MKKTKKILPQFKDIADLTVRLTKDYVGNQLVNRLP